MYRIKWEIETDLDIIYSRIHKLNIDLIALDTETDGLHPIKNKAHCTSFAVVDSKLCQGIAFTIRDKKTTVDILKYLVPLTKKILFWNAKYDLHMLYNIGINLVNNPKVIDVMVAFRLGTPAIPNRLGGPTMKLKLAAAKYVDPSARKYQIEVMKEKKQLLINRNKKIKEVTKYSIKELDTFLKDKTNEMEDLPEQLKNILKDKTLDPNNYANIPWKVLSEYASYDAIFTLELFLQFFPKVVERDQLRVYDTEQKIIPILWRIERTGLAFDKDYLNESKIRVKNYILTLRKELNDLLNEPIKVGQHAKIKEIFKNSFSLELPKVDSDQLNKISTEGLPKEIAKLIVELRTLEKWYSTYIIKLLENKDLDRLYTSFNQVGAVSGRFSSDFQQFPKESIRDRDGNILYEPRKVIIKTKNTNNKLVFMDFASEELRFQALYTVLIGHPDINLCRAYVPFQCIRYENGNIIKYELTNENAKTFQQYAWFLIEDPKVEWKPTDLHTKMCLKAFPQVKETDENFSHYRKIAKSSNFCLNYDGGKQTLQTQFGYSEELANTLYNAYIETFPGVLEYRSYIRNVLMQQPYITNLFGRRYYDASWHNCSNYLIQGSAADFLKEKIIEIDALLKPYQSKMLILLHDEIGYEIVKGEEFLIPKLKQIMEDFNAPIPMVSEIEITETNWAEKVKL